MKKRMVIKAALGIGILALVVSHDLAAQTGSGAYVKGVVLRDGRPVRSAWVILTQNNDEKGRSLTGDDGKYYIGEIGSGVHEIAVWEGQSKVFTRQLRLPDNKRFDIQINGR